MKIDQPSDFVSGWLKSPFIIENAARTYAYVSSLIGGSLKSTCESLNPTEIDEITIDKLQSLLYEISLMIMNSF